jgi:hypothetical protein
MIKNVKILGMTFDNNLNWNKYISTLKTNTIKTTNIIKILLNNKWGAQNEILLKVHHIALIRSIIDYGSIIYGSAKETILAKLQTIQNINLQLIACAFKSSSINSLLCISGKISRKKETPITRTSIRN